MRIAIALRAMAGAEGCDGEPYDLMQVASEHIEKLETENKTYLDEVDRQAEEIINQDEIIEQLQAEVEKYQEYFRSAEFENLDMLFSSDIEHMTALGKEIAKRSKLLLTELTNLKNDGMKKVLFGEVEALQNENVLLKQLVDNLQDFAIWMTGCGYDFCELDSFVKNRYLLTEEALTATPLTANISKKLDEHNKLIMAVACKFQNETRFETALRYISEREGFLLQVSELTPLRESP